jgi:hypothetical protein
VRRELSRVGLDVEQRHRRQLGERRAALHQHFLRRIG